MIQKRILLVLFALAVLGSCTSDPLDVDASGVKLDLSFTNLDSVIFYTDSATLIKEHRKFTAELGELYEYYQGFVMQIGHVEDTTFYNRIMIFREDPGIQTLEKEIKTEFPDLAATENNIIGGFQHLKYHLPDASMPSSIVFMNSLFTSNVWCSEAEIGIGLERYLGPESETVKKLPPEYYDWVRKAMDRKFMNVDILTAWIETNIVEAESGNLAEKMIRWGKILYLVKASFPEVEDHLILRYDEEQLSWAMDNEYAFWKYLVDEKMLFDTNERNELNFLNPGPTTPGLPEEGSPDRMGRFIGWRMVKSYVENNDVSPAKLLKTDYNTILQNYEID